MVGVCQFVFPYLQLLSCASSNAPMLSKAHGQQVEIEAQFDVWLDGSAIMTCISMTTVLGLVNDMIQRMDKTKDHASQSWLWYWSNLTSDFAFDAGVLGLAFWDMKL